MADKCPATAEIGMGTLMCVRKDGHKGEHEDRRTIYMIGEPARVQVVFWHEQPLEEPQ